MARPSAARKMIRQRSPRRLETTALTACLRSHCKSSEEGKTRLAMRILLRSPLLLLQRKECYINCEALHKLRDICSYEHISRPAPVFPCHGKGSSGSVPVPFQVSVGLLTGKLNHEPSACLFFVLAQKRDLH